MKIKGKILKITDVFKNTFYRLPITLLLIVIATIINVVNVNTELFESQTFENIMIFFTVFTCGTFFLETFKKENNLVKMGCYILFGIIALVAAFLNNIESSEILGMSDELFELYYVKTVYAYILCLVIATIYKIYNDSKLNFEEYLIKVAINICKVIFTYIVLAAGALIVSCAFIYLILDGQGYTFISSVEVLIFGLYFFPNLLYSLFDTKVEIGKYAKGLVRYVLDVLVILAFCVIYAYIIKIMVTFKMPSNMIFRILAILFSLSMPIWTAAMYFKDNDILSKINKKLPVLFIPFIILQIYAIGARILSSGLTPVRYLGVMLVIFEIIYILIYILKREKIAVILPVSMVIVLVSLVVPYINMVKLSQISQYYNLKIYTGKDNNYTDEQISKIQGAYEYLLYSVNGEELIAKYLTDEDIIQIKNLSGDYVESSSYASFSYLNLSCDLESFSVEGYSNVYCVSLSDYFSDSKEEYPIVDDVFSNIDIMDSDEKTMIVNLSENINYYIEEYKNIEDDFSSYNVIDIDDNTRLIIRSLYIGYKVKTSGTQIRSYTINGYLLVK